jgi:hypothetical protein
LERIDEQEVHGEIDAPISGGWPIRPQPLRLLSQSVADA